jgi:hypothetical protein
MAAQVASRIPEGPGFIIIFLCNISGQVFVAPAFRLARAGAKFPK